MSILLLNLFDGVTSMQLFCLAFLSILFLQSGLDKVFYYNGNMNWLKEHFSKSPLKNTVGIMVPVITVLEVASGVFSLVGLIMILMGESTQLGLVGAQLSTLSILSLFFGQRLAQDYAGAATLAKYFVVCMIAIYALS